MALEKESLREKFLLELLRECEVEGEDTSLALVVKRLLARRPEVAPLAKEVAEVLDLPPRVALARLAKMSEWREAARKAAARYIRELVE